MDPRLGYFNEIVCYFLVVFCLDLILVHLPRDEPIVALILDQVVVRLGAMHLGDEVADFDMVGHWRLLVVEERLLSTFFVVWGANLSCS